MTYHDLFYSFDTGYDVHVEWTDNKGHQEVFDYTEGKSEND